MRRCSNVSRPITYHCEIFVPIRPSYLHLNEVKTEPRFLLGLFHLEIIASGLACVRRHNKLLSPFFLFFFFSFFETPFYLQSIYIYIQQIGLRIGTHYCPSVVIRVMSLVGRGGIILISKI
jgi:hypothetical protein